MSTLSLGKIDKYEYLTGEKIQPYDQSRIIEQAKFTYSLRGKVFSRSNRSQGFFKINVQKTHTKQINK